MKYVLKGRIAMDNPYSLDKTLTIEGLGADAKAVGDALQKKVNTADVVDNLTTSDASKPLSANQGRVLNQKIDSAVSQMEETVQQEIGDTKQMAETAQSMALSAQTIAQNTQTYVDDNLSGYVKTVNGLGPDEFGNVNVEAGGDTETIVQQVIEEIAGDDIFVTEVVEKITTNTETMKEIVESMPQVSQIDFTNFANGSFTKTVDGEVVTHAVTFDSEGRPTAIDDVAIVWGTA